MSRSTGFLAKLTIGAALALVSLTVGSANAGASTSCGLVTAAGHPWIVVAKAVPCPTAKRVVNALAARTAAVRTGGSVTVTTPLLPGFHCVLASRGKPGGSCSTSGAAKSILWLLAA